MAAPEAGPVILVVDDEPSVMRIVTTALSSAGFRLLTAQNGQAGLELFQENAGEIRLVLADIAMPVMGGIRMAEAILELQPSARILLMTGYNDTVVGAGALQLPLIRKPFLPADLVRKVKALLENGARKTRQ